MEHRLHIETAPAARLIVPNRLVAQVITGLPTARAGYVETGKFNYTGVLLGQPRGCRYGRHADEPKRLTPKCNPR